MSDFEAIWELEQENYITNKIAKHLSIVTVSASA